MKVRFISLFILFAVVITLITGAIYSWGQRINTQDIQWEQIVAINEIEQLAKAGEYDKMSEKSARLQEKMRSVQVVSNENNRLFVLCGVCILFFAFALMYLYYSVLRPFDKMKQFAQKIAAGNFDVPLNYERSNYFGEFTWAFDSMRREITKARSCEREAIENNKTVIATLSHDIKTPISSIRAYAEGLEANLDGTPERRSKYLKVLIKKCDEVSGLTNDLFLHSLSDLNKLKISLEEIELSQFLEDAIPDIMAEQNDLHFIKPDFHVMVSVDKNRLLQITENLINNARKYAKSEIEITMTKQDNSVEVHFLDYGTGIPDEDMPFIFHKFYRGKNCGKEQGSGLGLYIVKYIAEQMQGKILLHNHTQGLEAILVLPVISIESNS